MKLPGTPQPFSTARPQLPIASTRCNAAIFSYAEKTLASHPPGLIGVHAKEKAAHRWAASVGQDSAVPRSQRLLSEPYLRAWSDVTTRSLNGG